VHAVTATSLLRLLQSFVAVYAVLLGCYLATGLAITRLNRRRGELKIQKHRVLAPAQITRGMRQSIVSLAIIALLFSLGNWFYGRFGWGFHPLRMTLPGALLSFAASMVLYDAWFYWLHRLVRHKRLYRHAHRWRHMTTAPVVWSNNSDTLLDNCFLQSYWLVAHFILPISPVVLLVHKIYTRSPAPSVIPATNTAAVSSRRRHRSPA
jgi:Delta7-sterol 5-desaturase